MKYLITALLLLIICVGSSFSQNGKILQKHKITLSELPIWPKLSENDSLLPQFAHLDQIDVYRIQYESDSLPVMGIYLEPKKAGKYPVVIFNRGGNRDYSQLSIPMMLIANGQLAAEGYVVIGSNYRTQDEFGGNDLHDVLNLFHTVEDIEKADTSRIGMFGWSRGAMMTYMTLKETCRLKTAIVGNGPIDLLAHARFRPKMEKFVFAQCIPDYQNNKDEELTKRSVLFWPEDLCKSTSLLIFSGTKDQRVDPQQIDRLDAKLKAIDYDYEIKKYETDHFFSDHKQELFEQVILWFNAKL